MQTVDTHRAELREVNELNYARFDTRMNELRDVTDARFGELRHELRADIATLRMETQAGIADVRDEVRTGFAEVRNEMRTGFAEVRNEMRTGFAEAKVTSAGLEAKIDRRFTEFVRWSFLFWCGAIAAAALARI
jgi:ribosomal protein L29